MKLSRVKARAKTRRVFVMPEVEYWKSDKKYFCVPLQQLSRYWFIEVSGVCNLGATCDETICYRGLARQSCRELLCSLNERW